MFLLLASFLAGMLTSIAPCILPLLPVIVGSASLKGSDKELDRKKPYVIAGSLALSVILFTLLLKVSTALIGVDPAVWTYISGGIVIVLGLSLLFPNLWVQVSARLGFEHSSNSLLARAHKQSGLLGQIATGAALGPVFSSCSPVYALVLATVLPVNVGLGLVYIVAYATGLAVALLGIALAGRRLTSKLGWAANPNGWFRRIVAIILILVGIGVITGLNAKFQTWAAEHIPFVSTRLEQKLLPKAKSMVTSASAMKQTQSLTRFNIDPYEAPEIRGIQGWVNSDGETLAKLRGKVVLIDFWTYSCINCQRTQPYLNSWYSKYKDKGFEIIGVHAPEFAFEHEITNVRRAVAEEKIGYPVGLDNDLATWNAFNNQYWPAKYLIDKNGIVRYNHFGEGSYAETESAIQTLLSEAGKQVNVSITQDPRDSPVGAEQSPETYLGYERGQRFANASEFKADQVINYKNLTEVGSDQWSLAGKWKIESSSATAQEDNAKLKFTVNARDVYLVMSGPSDKAQAGKAATLTLNGQKVTASSNGGSDVDADGNLYPSEARLYKLIKADQVLRDGKLEITLPKGVTVNAFTFGND